MSNYEDLIYIYEKIKEYKQAEKEYNGSLQAYGSLDFLRFGETEQTPIKKAILKQKSTQIRYAIQSSSLRNKVFLQELWERNKKRFNKLLENKLFLFEGEE